jgi:serine/threonine protein kinase
MKEQHGPIQDPHSSIRDGQSRGHFGNYDLVRRIDVGGMGEVYLARQRTAFGREVALKVIRSDLVHNVTARKRFLREAEVSAHLKHEHILPLFEFGEEQGRLFLVTPYIEGGTLARRLQSGPLSLSEVHQLFSALVQAVAYIHKRGVIHRDLKPSNILLDREDGNEHGQIYVRLIDFGIASIQGMAASPPLTTAGNEMGTIAYMAPERLDGVAAASNDIYSLGVILYQMLTGHLPSTEPLVELPEPLAEVVRRSTAPDPADRFASADELLRAFEHAYRSALVSLPRARPIQTDPPPVALVSPVLPTQRTPEPDDSPTPRRLTAAHPVETAAHESRKSTTAPRPEIAVSPLPPLPRSSRSFSGEDYNAPTTYIGPDRLASNPRLAHLADEALITANHPRKKRKKRSLLPLIPISIVLILLAISMLLLYGFQAAITASVTLSPQVHSFSKVFTLTARQGLQGIDASSASIPLYALSRSDKLTKTGPTSGQPILCFFNCPKVVSFNDVITLASAVKKSLIAQLTQELNGQLQSKDESAIAKPVFKDGNYTINPPIGTTSDTVSFTLTEQASIQYVANQDARNLARVLLQQQIQQQFGSHYTLLNQLTQVGQPVLQAVTANGVTVQIAAGGVAQYSISAADMQNIQSHIKGMKEKNAYAFIAKQPGIDPNAITLHVSYGDTLPNNMQQIKVVSVNATNLPPVQLPTVQSAPTPNASATPNA